MTARRLAVRTVLAASVLVLAGATVRVAGETSGTGGQAAADAAAESTLELDLQALIDGLTGTSAIGGFAKLSVKGKAQDLLLEVEALHRGEGDLTLEQLRERYDLLVNKVLLMLQGKDDALARQIAASREALWRQLADAERFAALRGGL